MSLTCFDSQEKQNEFLLGYKFEPDTRNERRYLRDKIKLQVTTSDTISLWCELLCDFKGYQIITLNDLKNAINSYMS